MAGRTIPVVQTAGLTKIFRDFWRRAKVEAVKNLNLEIAPGEVFGLLGPNGSGKSTAIKMLLGLLYPTRGEIAVFGRAPTDVATKARIGFLPEESYLYRFLDARETLDYYGRLFRLHRRVRKERIEKLLEMVGLRHEARRRLGEYSKGMARRIGLAQALINDPDLLILDEPTAGLDPIGTRQIKDLIRELGDRGKTILLSSHLLADVEDVCDRITILYGGQQRAAGQVRDLLSQKELTQITTRRLSPKTIDQVRSLLKRLESKDIIRVSSPAEKLETLFLRIVEEAQAANIATSGVRAAGKMPDFLGAEGPREDLVQRLVEAATRPTPTETVEPVSVASLPTEPSTAVLDRLLAPETTVGRVSRPDKEQTPIAESAPEPEAPTEAPAPQAETSSKPIDADRGVIDSLLPPDETSEK